MKLHPAKLGLLWPYFLLSLTECYFHTFHTLTGSNLAKWWSILENYSLKKNNLKKKKLSVMQLLQNRRYGYMATYHVYGTRSKFFSMPEGRWACIFSVFRWVHRHRQAIEYDDIESSHPDLVTIVHKQWNMHYIRDGKPRLKLICLRTVSFSTPCVSDSLKQFVVPQH